MEGKHIIRKDFQLTNKRNLKLECSHWEPVNRVQEKLPCVIYLHGNSSSRVESLQTLKVLLPNNITVFSFDFAGCGLSEGEYISLGWYERDDVDYVVDYLRKTEKVLTIGLWGRSMGAVTAIMHADRDPSIAGIVLDSPFSNLRELSLELATKHSNVPKLLIKGALGLIRKTIKERAKFDIDDISPIDHVKQAFIPAFFIVGNKDDFIDPTHTEKMYAAYAGDKNISRDSNGDHNSPRPSYIIDSVGIFFYNTLQCQLLPVGEDKKEQFEGPQFNPMKMPKIGNEKEVQGLFGMSEEEQMAKAIEESLKLSAEPKAPEKPPEPPKEEEKSSKPKPNPNPPK